MKYILMMLLLTGCIFAPDESKHGDTTVYNTVVTEEEDEPIDEPVVDDPPIIVVPPIEEPPIIVEPPVVLPISTVTIYWSAPVERVNGEAMPLDEIGGYEIRYRLTADTLYSNVIIEGYSIEQWMLEIEHPELYTFEVAVYDTDGIYSDFVEAQ